MTHLSFPDRTAQSESLWQHARAGDTSIPQICLDSDRQKDMSGEMWTNTWSYEDQTNPGDVASG